jgi:hypothetical protein
MCVAKALKSGNRDGALERRDGRQVSKLGEPLVAA